MTEWVWGVDVAVSHLEFAFANLNSDLVVVESLVTKTKALQGERLGLVDRQVRIYAAQMMRRFPPHVVWVEQPSGRFTSPQLMYVAGVLQAALFEVLGCPVWTIPSSAWKKLAVGSGNASKFQVASWCERMGYVCVGQDQADAVGVAVAGRLMVRAGSWTA